MTNYRYSRQQPFNLCCGDRPPLDLHFKAIPSVSFANAPPYPQTQLIGKVEKVGFLSKKVALFLKHDKLF